MEIVWKNDMGTVLATHRFTGIDPAIAIECQHWSLTAGDTIEIRNEPIDEIVVFEQLQHNVHEIFRMMHDRCDINNGDISPLQQLKLDAEMRALADSITTILQEQRGE